MHANRRRCGAAVAHLSCVIVSSSVPPSPLSRPPLPSHPKFTMFFAALSSPFPGRLCTYPSILWVGRRVGGGELTSESSDAAVEKEGIWTMKEHHSLCFSTSFGNLTLREVDMSPQLDRSLTCTGRTFYEERRRLPGKIGADGAHCYS